jgi:phage terminase large subunit
MDKPLEPICIYVPDGKGGQELIYESLDHQTEFHISPQTNVLMEGGRGTGKSIAIRMDAHMRATSWPGFTYLILRRTMPELKKSHFGFIEAEMKKLGGFYHKTDKIAYYPNGSAGHFGHCETEADILDYLSSQYGAIYFDELSTFTLDMFLQISSSARAEQNAPYSAIVRGGTNPLGEGSSWVKQWFIDKTVNYAEFQDYNPNDFHSIHSVYTDNPHLNREQYRKQLSNLPSHVRAAWLEGQWIDPDGYFADFMVNQDEQPWHVIDQLPTVKGKPVLEQPWISIYRAVDWGFHPDPAVCLWIAVLPNKRAIVFKEKTWLRATAAEVAKDIVRESEGMRIVETFSDPSMGANAGHTGLSIEDYYNNNGVHLTPSRNDRAAAGAAIHEWLNTTIDEQPKLQILRHQPSSGLGCPNLLRTIPDMRCDKRDASKIADGEDHWVIALGYFCQGDVTHSIEPLHSSIPLYLRPQVTRKVLGNKNVRSR